MRGIVICSGGMDSVTLAYYLKDLGDDIQLVGFDYGQKHAKELGYAMKCADNLKTTFTHVDMSFLRHLLPSALTSDDQDVPEGHYADDTMKQTVVPNRNMIMLSIATGIATARELQYVATGVHAGDHPVYPDCRPEFIQSINITAMLATNGFGFEGFEIVAPFVRSTKADIAKIGSEIGVDYRDTWSCYKGGLVHCGVCGTCVERKEAFQLSGVKDTTEYE